MARDACQATFNTTELLEQIIFHLPGRAILAHASLVSKSWNNAIKTCPAIQMELWQRPESTRVSSPAGLSDDVNMSQPPPWNVPLNGTLPTLTQPGVSRLTELQHSAQAYRSTGVHTTSVRSFPTYQGKDLIFLRDLCKSISSRGIAACPVRENNAWSTLS
jgi:hypothetical protein